jgi:hypothetical protein
MVRYPRAKFVAANESNIGGYLNPGAVSMFVVHIAQGNNQSGCDAWFQDPAAQVSAHFSVSRMGVVHQYVDLDRQAWAEENYNDMAISIEHMGYSGDKLTWLQLRASVRLLRWLHEVFPAVPAVRVGSPSSRGVIGHGELGVPGGDHPDCPGTPVLYQFNVALRPHQPTSSKARLPFMYRILHSRGVK